MKSVGFPSKTKEKKHKKNLNDESGIRNERYIAYDLPSFVLKLAKGKKLGLTYYEKENNKRGMKVADCRWPDRTFWRV